MTMNGFLCRLGRDEEAASARHEAAALVGAGASYADGHAWQLARV
jgi:hypothetical protein